MKEGRIVDVQTGEVAVGRGSAILEVGGIGSCVVVAMLDYARSVAGAAHLMLPGKCPHPGGPEVTRYVFDGIDELLKRMLDAGAGRKALRVCVAGGANVVRRMNDTVCDAIIASVEEKLSQLGLVPEVEDTGGVERRSLTVDAAGGVVCCKVGDSAEKVLFDCRQPRG